MLSEDDRHAIELVRRQAVAMLGELTERPRPSYAVDGQRVGWAEYLAQLQAVVDWCDGQLRRTEPFEVHSQGVT